MDRAAAGEDCATDEIIGVEPVVEDELAGARSVEHTATGELGADGVREGERLRGVHRDGTIGVPQGNVTAVRETCRGLQGGVVQRQAAGDSAEAVGVIDLHCAGISREPAVKGVRTREHERAAAGLGQEIAVTGNDAADREGLTRISDAPGLSGTEDDVGADRGGRRGSARRDGDTVSTQGKDTIAAACVDGHITITGGRSGESEAGDGIWLIERGADRSTERKDDVDIAWGSPGICSGGTAGSPIARGGAKIVHQSRPRGRTARARPVIRTGGGGADRQF